MGKISWNQFFGRDFGYELFLCSVSFVRDFSWPDSCSKHISFVTSEGIGRNKKSREIILNATIFRMRRTMKFKRLTQRLRLFPRKRNKRNCAKNFPPFGEYYGDMPSLVVAHWLNSLVWRNRKMTNSRKIILRCDVFVGTAGLGCDQLCEMRNPSNDKREKYFESFIHLL